MPETSLENLFVDHAELIAREVQHRLRHYPVICDVVKTGMPDDTVAPLTILPHGEGYTHAPSASFGYTERICQLYKSAINSPAICLYDVKFQWQFSDCVENVTRLMVENLKWVWQIKFRDSIAKVITHRRISRELYDDIAVLKEPFPKGIDIFGHTVPCYLATPATSLGTKWIVNPKYKRSAKQYIVFHPDIVHFAFPNPITWAAELSWKNIPDPVTNPDGCIGYFRALLSVMPRPMRPDLGEVVTVTPAGIRGWCWYHIWKLLKFIP